MFQSTRRQHLAHQAPARDGDHHEDEGSHQRLQNQEDPEKPSPWTGQIHQLLRHRTSCGDRIVTQEIERQERLGQDGHEDQPEEIVTAPSAGANGQDRFAGAHRGGRHDGARPNPRKPLARFLHERVMVTDRYILTSPLMPDAVLVLLVQSAYSVRV